MCMRSGNFSGKGGRRRTSYKKHNKEASESNNKPQHSCIMNATQFKVQKVDLQQVRNQIQHRTDDLSSKTLVLRRGQPFTILINSDGRPFDPQREKLVFVLGPLNVDVPLSVSGQPSPNQWSAIQEKSLPIPYTPCPLAVSLSSPVSAYVGVYELQLRVETGQSAKTYFLGHFTLLCNPWCEDDSVFLPSEDLRNEYVCSDYGVLYKGSPCNMFLRPWSFNQYDKGMLDICMQLLQLSPQSQADMKKDLLNRSSPVYISRVVSAMVNCQDDKGVLQGNWTQNYSGGVNPSTWSGSGDILRMWSETQFSPVKYGQCWVFAAVMCTVMRALGIPTRVVTNFHSGHDSNDNMVIEEYYSEMGEKLSIAGQDSIWNFHVWVESWMKRPDLGQGYDGWQALDSTPQKKSRGIFRCGPASVKAISEKKVDMPFDVPFIYAEMNADVHKIIIRNGNRLSCAVEKDRVGVLICTKHPGSKKMQDITAEYKPKEDDFRCVHFRAPFKVKLRSIELSDADGDLGKVVPEGIAVSLQLLKAPIVGENISFNVIIINEGDVSKKLRKHVNAQSKEYNCNPTEAFWKADNDLVIGPYETMTVKHEISFKEYMLKEVMEDHQVNLAVVIEDVESQKRVMASEEFHIKSPALKIHVQNKRSVIINEQQLAMVTFTNTFDVAVSGELTIEGSGLFEKVQISLTIQPGETIWRPISIIPRMTGDKMLHGSLVLTNLPIILRGFKTVSVQAAKR
ncbi:protein-glutamine gamma-glutamyltransferase 5-like isoform X2 [Ctenopharyngodon idella]|uniref:protein-glutamine gamma-glutamyltransferase 5-like isoform X2 n=1 Tax=Ctenopharyngodon idella TaxID=7959 RepID=UPI00222FACEC|nr:protein-glutamine gamma-glutamyltransferase 5-like isoform X2 [Ctenopharyngodon idella]